MIEATGSGRIGIGFGQPVKRPPRTGRAIRPCLPHLFNTPDFRELRPSRIRNDTILGLHVSDRDRLAAAGKQIDQRHAAQRQRLLADGAFQRFSLAYTERVLRQLKTEHEGRRVPCIVFSKGGGLWLEEMAAIGPDVLGLDWTMNLGAARARVGDRVALQGNLDPNVLFAPPAQIEAEVRAVLDSFGAHRQADGSVGGHVFNLGHGISQHTPPEHVDVLVNMVHDHSKHLHRQEFSRGSIGNLPA